MGFGAGSERPETSDSEFGFVAGDFGGHRAHFHRDKKKPEASFLDVFVVSSNGRDSYNVIVSYDLSVECSCLGWSYRRYCRHSSKVLELMQNRTKFIENIAP